MADAGQDFSISVGDAPEFDGCDSGGPIANYRWVILTAPDSKPGDVDKTIRDTMSSCSFTLESLMEVDEVGAWTIELTVSDDSGTTSSDTVVVTVGA